MAVKVRLCRVGKTNRPYCRVIVVDSRKKRDGAFLENLGTYDPICHNVIRLDKDRIYDWVKKGAICSDAVKKLLRIDVKHKDKS